MARRWVAGWPRLALWSTCIPWRTRRAWSKLWADWVATMLWGNHFGNPTENSNRKAKMPIRSGCRKRPGCNRWTATDGGEKQVITFSLYRLQLFSVFYVVTTDNSNSLCKLNNMLSRFRVSTDCMEMHVSIQCCVYSCCSRKSVPRKIKHVGKKFQFS